MRWGALDAEQLDHIKIKYNQEIFRHQGRVTEGRQALLSMYKPGNISPDMIVQRSDFDFESGRQQPITLAFVESPITQYVLARQELAAMQQALAAVGGDPIVDPSEAKPWKRSYIRGLILGQSAFKNVFVNKAAIQ